MRFPHAVHELFGRELIAANGVRVFFSSSWAFASFSLYCSCSSSIGCVFVCVLPELCVVTRLCVVVGRMGVR